MASTIQEVGVMALPFETVKGSPGFSMDIGGSVAKLVYRDKRDWNDQQNEPHKIDDGFAQVRLVMVPRESFQELIKFVKEHCHINRHKGDETVINVTGRCCSQHRKEIESHLQIRLNIVTEPDCFSRAFRYLCTNVSEEKFLEKESEYVTENYQKRLEEFQEILRRFATMDSTTKVPLMDEIGEREKTGEAAAKKSNETTNTTEKSSIPHENADLFPCLLCVLGSNVGFLKVQEEDTISVEMSKHGGKMFLGLGSLLTGAKTYEELMDLAKNGDSSNVDIHIRDIEFPSAEDDVYNINPPDSLAFLFGKAAGRKIDDFKKEDTARALVQLMCIQLAELTHNIQLKDGFKIAYMCGGIGNDSLVRDMMTLEFLTHTFYRGDVGQRSIRFVKHGIHLCALGAFIATN